ncbi:MAG: M23 family metallopeptidase, partial [Caldilineaceae bacterium]|nr:M23 family metallopeptidase [Caldilineaceae bacterium]
MSTPTSIHHGLSVLSDADASQRLAHPLPVEVTLHRIVDPELKLPVRGFDGPRQVFNVFNDALTAVGYKDPNRFKHAAGHPGIDYLCTTGQKVTAMYGGVVTEVDDSDRSANPPPAQYRRKNMTIRSWTRWNSTKAGRLGFEIRYAHLESLSVAAGDVVKKGQVIGRSGTTGTWTPHLHVDFKAFNDQGMVTSEDYPGNLVDHPEVAAAAQRIVGFMNFACFLPADDDDAPDITQELLNQGPGKLLSVRSASPFFPEPVLLPRFVPVYTAEPTSYDGTVSTPFAGWLPHSKIGCYAIQDESEVVRLVGPHTITYKLYQIQWKNDQKAWIPYRRKLISPQGYETETVQVEDASTPPLPSHAVVHTQQRSVGAYHSPAIRNIPNPHGGVTPSLGYLTPDRGYDIQGTYVDPVSRWLRGDNPVAAQARLRWWQIDYNGRPGWVRSDKVNEA